MYVSGRGIRRVVFWNDANGSTFVLSPVGVDEGEEETELIVEHCTVVYARSKGLHWNGGRVFNMWGQGKGTGGSNLVFRNIRVEDPRPTLQHFMIAMQGVCNPVHPLLSLIRLHTALHRLNRGQTLSSTDVVREI